jgi:hypothetical protein
MPVYYLDYAPIAFLDILVNSSHCTINVMKQLTEKLENYNLVEQASIDTRTSEKVTLFLLSDESSPLKIRASVLSEALVFLYGITWRLIPEVRNIHVHCRENVRSHDGRVIHQTSSQEKQWHLVQCIVLNMQVILNRIRCQFNASPFLPAHNAATTAVPLILTTACARQYILH